MEDQGKRLLVALAIMAALFVAMQYIFPPKRQAKKDKDTATEASGPDAGAGAAQVNPSEVKEPSKPGVEPTKPVTPTEATCDPATAPKESLEGEDFTMEVTACGGAVKSWVLRDLQW